MPILNVIYVTGFNPTVFCIREETSSIAAYKRHCLLDDMWYQHEGMIPTVW